MVVPSLADTHCPPIKPCTLSKSLSLILSRSAGVAFGSPVCAERALHAMLPFVRSKCRRQTLGQSRTQPCRCMLDLERCSSVGVRRPPANRQRCRCMHVTRRSAVSVASFRHRSLTSDHTVSHCSKVAAILRNQAEGVVVK